MKTNAWTYKIKDLNGKKNNRKNEKEVLLSKLWMSYYLETECHIRDKAKVVFVLSNYVTGKELGHAKCIDRSNFLRL